MGKAFLVMGAVFALAAFGCGGSSVDDGDDDEDGNGGTGNGGTFGGGGTGNGGTLGGGGGGGGRSGVPREKYLDELTPAEQRLLCQWAIAAQGGTGEHVCADTTTVTVATVDECSMSDLSSFHCSVSSVEDCIASLNGDPCSLPSEAACAEYIACAADSAG